MLTFQDVILKLLNYWVDQGAVLWQPYSEKVGAGTMNPATILRVLGPEPWNVVYTEPSYRPDDGRAARALRGVLPGEVRRVAIGGVTNAAKQPPSVGWDRTGQNWDGRSEIEH